MSARINAIHKERHLWCVLDPQAIRVLTELKRMGLRLAAISNTEDGRLGELLKLTGILLYFELLLDSYIIGYRKPDAAIFHLALERLDLTFSDAVYIGDSYGHDILGAEGAGLRAILFDPFDLYKDSTCSRITCVE